MATISPVSAMSGEVQTVTWTGLSTSTDTAAAYGPMNKSKGALRAAVTFSGTFGGATVLLTGSIDGTNYATLTDKNGNAISATAAKVQEFTSSVLYLKPTSSGGTGDNINIVVAMRN